MVIVIDPYVKVNYEAVCLETCRYLQLVSSMRIAYLLYRNVNVGLTG